MRLPPLEVIESWPVPNYAHPVTRGTAAIYFNLVLFPLVCFIIALRLYTRLRISKSFGLDDWLIVAAVFPTCAFAVISLLTQFLYGWNRHIWDVEPSAITISLKLVLASEILFDAAQCLTKLSMLALTYRINESGSKAIQKVTVGVMALVALESSIFFFSTLFQCRPPAQYWTLSMTPQSCISESLNLLTAGIINTTTDFIVVILPIPTVWKLRLTKREQAILIILFGTGFMVSVAGCVRTVYTYLGTISYDRTWASTPVWVSSCVELYVGIICASMPATKKFFSHFIPRLFETSIAKSRTAVSNQSNSKQSCGPGTLSDVELGMKYKSVSPLPHERKNETTSNVEDISIPENSYSGFDFGIQERVDTLQSSKDGETEGMHNASRSGSYDELVPKAEAEVVKTK